MNLHFHFLVYISRSQTLQVNKIIATAIGILNYRSILITVSVINSLWKLEIGKVDFKTRQNLERVPQRGMCVASSSGCKQGRVFEVAVGVPG